MVDGPALERRKTRCDSNTLGKAFLRAIIAGLIGDRTGQNFVSLVVFTTAAIIRASANSYFSCRLINSFSVRRVAMIMPHYTEELALACYRGRLIIFGNLFVAGG